MAFGATLTLPYNAGTKVLNRINQDSYGSEFYLREATKEFRVKIRHTKDAANAAGIVMERHNVEFTETVFATSVLPSFTRHMYAVFRNQVGDTTVDPGYLFAGAIDYLDSGTVQADLIAWMN